MTASPEQRTPDQGVSREPRGEANGGVSEHLAAYGDRSEDLVSYGDVSDGRASHEPVSHDLVTDDLVSHDLVSHDRVSDDLLSGDLAIDLSDAEADFAEGPKPPRNPPRWVRWTVVPLLVLVPMVYVVISAAQSRGAGESEQQLVASDKLEQIYPTLLQQRIYQVPVPVGSRYTRYLETNSWDTSVFYAEFLTTAGGLDTFLAQVGTSREALRPGKVTITAAQSKAAGWNFAIPHTWAGVSLHQYGDKPDHDVTVDLTHPDTPRVYVVSTVNFQHGFGGGN